MCAETDIIIVLFLRENVIPGTAPYSVGLKNSDYLLEPYSILNDSSIAPHVSYTIRTRSGGYHMYADDVHVITQ